MPFESPDWIAILPYSVWVLFAAALLDFLIGDPWTWPHPVQAIGCGIQHASRFILKTLPRSRSQHWAGIVMGVAVVGLTGGMSWGLVYGARELSALWGWLVEVVLLASCFAGRSLRAAAEDVLRPLMQSDLVAARQQLSRYVGRDTEKLSETEILRATLETVAENTTDGVMAPLFYAIVGMLLPTGPVPLAMAYKAVSTLDSMIGYRESPYTFLGRFSAKLDDVATWLPCRLTVITLGAVSGDLLQVWRLCRRDAHQDPSPNSGWSECAYAAVLGVQLGGLNTYRGVVKVKPFLGNYEQPITVERIQLALRLMRNCIIFWLLWAMALKVGMNELVGQP